MAKAMKKRIWMILAVLLGLFVLPATALAEEKGSVDKSSIDISNIDSGYVTVYYAQNASAQFRVGIELNGSEQFVEYKGGSRSHIMLPGSSGELTVTLYEQVNGNAYKKVETRKFRKAKTADTSQLLLQSSNTLAPVLHAAEQQEGGGEPQIIDVPMSSGSLGSSNAAWSASRIVPPEYERFLASNKEISFTQGDAVSQKAAELVAGKSTTEAQVMAIYSYIITNFSYDWDFYYAVKSGRITTHTPDPNATLVKRKGVCYDIASLFAAMARSVGIPTKMIKGNATAAGGYHAWNSIYEFESLSWVDLDPTLNMGGKSTSLYKPLSRGYSAQSES